MTTVQAHHPDKDSFMGRVIHIANEPASRFKLIWYAFAWPLAIVYFIIGSGYASQGKSALNSNTNALHVVQDVEGNLHIHGFIMMGVATFLIYGLSDYRRITRWALVLYFFYSIWTAIMIFISFIYSISWGAPWWYMLTSTLSGILILLAPPLNKDGRRFAGYFEGSESA